MSTPNPLVNWDERPAYDQIVPADVVSAMTAVLQESEKALFDIEQDPPITWKGLMPRLEQIEDRVGRIWGVVGHLHNVKNSDELREVYQEVQPKIVTFYNRLNQSKPLYDVMTNMKEGESWHHFDNAQKRIIEGNLRNAMLAGVGLEGAAKEKYNENAKRLAELSTKFSNNLLDATKAFELILTTAEDVDGLPESSLQLAAQTARHKGHEEATAEDGPWLITLDFPSMTPFLRHSKRRDLREHVFRAVFTRASEGDKSNRELASKILQLRQEQAELLGFDTYADLSLSRKMAGSTEAVSDLLNQLRSAARHHGKKDVADIIEFARKHDAPEADDFKSWDYAFWSERLRESKFDLKDDELRPYFPLPRVLDGMFKIAKRLFGIDIQEANGAVPVWHEDVQYYKVFDENGDPLAAFYLDAYSRPSEKRGGAWMDILIGRSDVMARPGQDVRLPVAYMNCNQSPPVEGKPSLMTFSEVNTMFHEFGHALQHMLTHVDYGLAAGLANVEWDAVEIASQFMENWIYHRPTLKSMAHHYLTDEPLPDHFIDKILAARTFQAGYQMLRQTYFGLFDLTLHSSFDPQSESIKEVQDRIGSETMVLPSFPEDYFYCGFSHIFSGAYAAGYFSYKWAEVLSADAFGAFLEAGLDDEKAVQRLGRRFRDTILGEGGSRHPMEIYESFRGRPPTIDALLVQEGLVN